MSGYMLIQGAGDPFMGKIGWFCRESQKHDWSRPPLRQSVGPPYKSFCVFCFFFCTYFILQEGKSHLMLGNNFQYSILFVEFYQYLYVVYIEVLKKNWLILEMKFGWTYFTSFQIYSSLYSGIQTMIKEEGFLSFYKGLGAAVAQIGPQMGLQFGFFALFTRLWRGWFDNPDHKRSHAGRGNGFRKNVFVAPVNQ